MTDVAHLDPSASAARPDSLWRSVMQTAEGKAAAVLALIVAFVIAAGPFVAPFTPRKLGTGAPLEGPTLQHLFGTDQLGRDVFSRVMHGGSSVLIVPVLATVLAYAVGGSVGLWIAYRGGKADYAVSRALDVLLTLPPLLIVLVLVAGLGTSRQVLIGVVALVFAPRVARLVRAATQGVTHMEFVQAAQARRERTATILFREILPNLAAPLLADFALRATYAVMFIATLSFLGLGAQPPSSDWGLMVAESRSFLTVNAAATLAPALAIATVSLALNLFADALTKTISRERIGLGEDL